MPSALASTEDTKKNKPSTEGRPRVIKSPHILSEPGRDPGQALVPDSTATLVTYDTVAGEQLPMKWALRAAPGSVTYHGRKDRQEQGGGGHVACALSEHSNKQGQDQGDSCWGHSVQGLHLLPHPFGQPRDLGSTRRAITGQLGYSSSRARRHPPFSPGSSAHPPLPILCTLAIGDLIYACNFNLHPHSTVS